MKPILKYVFTNTFGNTLAILNLALIAINSAGISHALGAGYLVSTSVSLNLPAHIAAAITTVMTTQSYIGVLNGRMTHYSMFDLGFIYLQWTVIGSLSCAIANVIRRHALVGEPKKGNTGEFRQYSPLIDPEATE